MSGTASYGWTARVSATKRWFSRRADYFAAAAGYAVLTILFTWPLAENFTTFVNGNVMDVFHELWYLHLDFTAPLGPFFLLATKTILYPFGVPMYFQVLSPLNAIVGAPLYSLMGLIPTYNLLYMLSFIGSGITTYMLVRYLTKNGYAAFLAGVAFAFAPIHTAQGTAHLNVISSALLPLFVYFLLRMTREKNEWNGFYAGILVALNAMFDLHFLLDCMIITSAFLLYFLLAKREVVLNKGFIVRLSLMTVTAGLIGVAVYFQVVYGLIVAPASQGTAAAATLAGVHTQRSADLLQFFLPPPSNPILGAYTYGVYQNLLTSSSVQTFVGFTVLGLAVLGLASKRRDREVYLWAFMAFAGVLLALGPNLQVNGQVTPLQGVWSYFYYIIPLFRSFRTPYRIDFIVALGMAVLAGYGVAALTSRLHGLGRSRGGRVRWKAVVTVALCALIVVEFLPIPYPEMNAQIPPVYTQVLAQDHSSYAVLEVPAFLGNDVYLYYQTAYGQPTVTGHVSRTPASSLIFVQGAPFVTQFGQAPRKASPTNLDVLNQTMNTSTFGPYILSQFDIKYVIVHKDLIPPTTYASYVKTLSGVLGLPLYNDSLTTLFRVPTSPSLGIGQYTQQQNVTWVGLLTGSWNQLGLFAGHTRSMAEAGSVLVFSQTAGFYQVQFLAEGFGGNFQLRTSVNGESVGTYLMLNGTYAKYTTPFVRLNQGVNEVDFQSLEGCSVVSVGGNATAPLTTACTSAQFSWIDFLPANVG